MRIDTGGGFSDLPHEYDDRIELKVSAAGHHGKIEIDYSAKHRSAAYSSSPMPRWRRPEQVCSRCTKMPGTGSPVTTSPT
ncbi:MAG: hypothetical protein U0263_39260 [Polyangiaceae bacterium]